MRFCQRYINTGTVADRACIGDDTTTVAMKNTNGGDDASFALFGPQECVDTVPTKKSDLDRSVLGRQIATENAVDYRKIDNSYIDSILAVQFFLKQNYLRSRDRATVSKSEIFEFERLKEGRRLLQTLRLHSPGPECACEASDKTHSNSGISMAA